MNPNYFYIVSQCCHSSETRGNTKQERTNPCGFWNVQKSRRAPEEKPVHQNRCKGTVIRNGEEVTCGKRTNLSTRNTKVFREEIDAVIFAHEQMLKGIRYTNREVNGNGTNHD